MYKILPTAIANTHEFGLPTGVELIDTSSFRHHKEDVNAYMRDPRNDAQIKEYATFAEAKAHLVLLQKTSVNFIPCIFMTEENGIYTLDS